MSILSVSTSLEKLLFTYVPGTYAPSTIEGNIIVDGVLASCYADVPHDLGHLSMIPIQWFVGATKWILGYDVGFSAYVNIVKDLSLLMPNEQFWT